MRRFTETRLTAGLAGLLTAAAAFAIAGCTSSNTPTSGYSSNTGFDSNYREQTRSGQSYGDGTQPVTSSEPVYTLMALGTETGTLNPGEDYAIFAVADVPDRRNVEYVWSCLNGELSELPQADRGRIQSLIEQEDVLIRSGAADAPAVEPGIAAPENGGMPADGSAVPGALPGEPGSAATPPPAPSPVIPGGSLQQRPSGSNGTPQAGQLPLAPQPIASGGVIAESQGVSPGDGTGLSAGVSNASGASFTLDNLTAEQKQAPANIQQIYLKRLNNEPLTADEEEALVNYEAGKLSGSTRGGLTHTRRYVGNESSNDPDQAIESNSALSAEELADKALNAARTELEQFREAGGEAAGNLADRSSPAAPGNYDDYTHGSSFEAARSLRDEYNEWSDSAGPERRRGLGDSAEDSSEAVSADESYEEMSFVTDSPYVLWTPSRPGSTIIYCKLRWKDEVLTPAVALEAEITLREPSVAIGSDFQDVIREDENIFVRLDAENLPDFKKGLFTLEFDPDVLSFRGAELGEYFDDAPRASIYFAEPSKAAGKALLAIDSNTEIAELSGDGTLVYAKFKAKRDVSGQQETGLTLALDSASRYVLDRSGDNILPMPVERQPLRSPITTPPQQPDVNREAAPPGVPGAGQPAASGGTTPGAGTGPTIGPSGGTPAGSRNQPAAGQQQSAASKPVDEQRRGASSTDDTAPPEEAEPRSPAPDDAIIGPLPPLDSSPEGLPADDEKNISR